MAAPPARTPFRRPALIVACALHLSAATALAAPDLDRLWDFGQPAASEQRLREALAALPDAAVSAAAGNDALILRTQIARTFGLRRDFDRARSELQATRTGLDSASAEAQAHWQLEWGRSWLSATHPPVARTPAARAQARDAYAQALRLARQAGRDDLAVDALHMMAFVDEAPADQLRWNREALSLALASPQPAAKRWERSLRNNLGLALRADGQHAEAMASFEQLLALQRAQGAPLRAQRISQWHIGRSLRDLGRIDEAIAAQQALEAAFDAEGSADPYVFEELEQLHRLRGDATRAAHYAQRLRAVRP